MSKRSDLGNAFLDVALVGAVLVTGGIVIDLVRGEGVELPLIATALVIYGSYILGALRLGVSPVRYLRNVGRRGSLPHPSD